jgi:hypothetical protein
VGGLAAAAAAVLCLALTGCGQSAAPPVRPSAGAASPSAVLVLRFWDAVSARAYRAAYRDLDPTLRRALRYPRFVIAAAAARSVFARTPRVARVGGTGKLRTVYVASSRGDLARADAVQVVFSVRRYGAAWRIVSVPGATGRLGTPRAARPVKTAAARGQRPATR